jgi:hypothetical protein
MLLFTAAEQMYSSEHEKSVFDILKEISRAQEVSSNERIDPNKVNPMRSMNLAMRLWT